MSSETLVNKPVAAPPRATAEKSESPASTQKALVAAIVGDAAKVRAKWPSLIPAALAVWSRLQPEELAMVHGNYYLLVELIQLRYKQTREDVERQVKPFFDRHYGKVGAVLRPR